MKKSISLLLLLIFIFHNYVFSEQKVLNLDGESYNSYNYISYSSNYSFKITYDSDKGYFNNNTLYLQDKLSYAVEFKGSSGSFSLGEQAGGGYYTYLYDATNKIKYMDYVNKIFSGIKTLEVIEHIQVGSITNSDIYHDDISCKSINIKYDSVAPTIEQILDKDSVTFNFNNYYKDNVILNVRANDAESGVNYDKLILSSDNEDLKYTNEKGKITITNLTKSTNITLEICDNVGNKSTPQSYTLKVDNEPPQILLNGNETYNNEWIKQAVTITVADVSPCTLKLNDMAITLPHTITSNGTYKIEAEDEVGHTTNKTIKVDLTNPTISSSTISYIKDNDGKVSGVTVNAAGSDTDSGLKEIRIKNNGTVIGNTVSASILETKISNIDRNAIKEIKLSVEAEDKAGNQTTYNWGTAENPVTEKTVTIPPVLKLQMQSTAINKTTNNNETKLKIVNYSDDNKGYYNNIIKIKKSFFVEDGNGSEVELTENNFSQYYEESKRAVWESLVAEKNIAGNIIKEGTDYYYTDNIPVTSGFGHKMTSYKLIWEIPDLSAEESSEELKVLTADSVSRTQLILVGKNGKDNTKQEEIAVTISADGTIEYENNENFIIPENGMLGLKYKVNNSDLEKYSIEIKEVASYFNKGTNEEIPIVASKEGLISKGMMKDSKSVYSEYTEIYDGNTGNEFENPIYLYFNKPTLLMIYTKEGYKYDKEGTGETSFRSQIISLEAGEPDLGGFKLKVGQEAGYDANGVTAKPFMNVNLEIDAEDKTKTVSWNYGDGGNSGEYETVHSWNQKSDRTGDTSEYIMTINYGNNTAKIPVYIVDTQYGVMYGNEVWRGRHTVLSKIKIQDGQELRVGDETKTETKVMIISELDSEFCGGIEIETGGGLKVDNQGEKVVFTECHNTVNGFIENSKMDYGWQGIEVAGVCEVKNGILKYAKRGLICKDGSNTEIEGSELKNNGIGIHGYSGADITITNCEIQNNEEYGIKEDSSDGYVSGPAITETGNNITNNTVNRYYWNEAIK